MEDKQLKMMLASLKMMGMNIPDSQMALVTSLMELQGRHTGDAAWESFAMEQVNSLIAALTAWDAANPYTPPASAEIVKKSNKPSYILR